CETVSALCFLGGWCAAGGRAAFSSAGTAVFGEVGEQDIHLCVTGAHADHPALALVLDQSRGAQHIEVRGERSRRQVEPLAQLADRQALRPGLHEGAKGGQPGFLAECTEGGKSIGGIHDSYIPESWNYLSSRKRRKGDGGN